MRRTHSFIGFAASATAGGGQVRFAIFGCCRLSLSLSPFLPFFGRSGSPLRFPSQLAAGSMRKFYQMFAKFCTWISLLFRKKHQGKREEINLRKFNFMEVPMLWAHCILLYQKRLCCKLKIKTAQCKRGLSNGGRTGRSEK